MPASTAPRNPIAEALRSRRAGSGGGGSHRHKCAPRGGQRNVQADYQEEYLAETETGTIASEDDAPSIALCRPITTSVKGGFSFRSRILSELPLTISSYFITVFPLVPTLGTRRSLTLLGSFHATSGIFCRIEKTSRRSYRTDGLVASFSRD